MNSGQAVFKKIDGNNFQISAEAPTGVLRLQFGTPEANQRLV
jgi:hypothetical protein